MSDPQYHLKPSEQAAFFEHVSTVEEFFSKFEQIDREMWTASALHFGHTPQGITEDSKEPERQEDNRLRRDGYSPADELIGRLKSNKLVAAFTLPEKPIHFFLVHS